MIEEAYQIEQNQEIKEEIFSIAFDKYLSNIDNEYVSLDFLDKKMKEYEESKNNKININIVPSQKFIIPNTVYFFNIIKFVKN